MKTLENYMFESLDQPVKIKWVTQTEKRWIGDFVINDEYYEIKMEYSGNTWNVVFSKEESGDSTDPDYDEYALSDSKGQSIKIFATVVDGIITHHKAMPTAQYFFTADTVDPTRARLYNRMTKVYAKKYNMDLKITDKIVKIQYVLTPKG